MVPMGTPDIPLIMKTFKPTGGGNETHLCNSHYQDTEPYGIEAHVYDHGIKHGDREEDDGHGIHDTAKGQGYEKDNNEY